MLLRRGYVLLAVLLSFVLFNAQDLAQAGNDLRCLLGFGGLPLWGAETGYRLLSCGPLLVCGILGCGPWPRDMARRLGKTSAGPWLECLLTVLLLLVCTGYLVDGSFSPFLYFRF